ncbi:hypothetical protein IEQ34_015634 [Dendrobium chrysotoxum]|uniref:Uncharacterized protein n=1 Tax=Dendrobium chrysotoxum TaxID=161865 RepID=A0AAV7GI58_DENCH|nr:hypothetical protein IEQ34_015634 [Dendrobium chrysotoxum]
MQCHKNQKIPLVVFRFEVKRVRLIEINLIVSTSRYNMSSRYDVTRRRIEDESSRDRKSVSDKKSKYNDSRGTESIAATGSYNERIHYGRRHSTQCYLLKG